LRTRKTGNSAAICSNSAKGAGRSAGTCGRAPAATRDFFDYLADKLPALFEDFKRDNNLS
jgi:hypothetical protein